VIDEVAAYGRYFEYYAAVSPAPRRGCGRFRARNNVSYSPPGAMDTIYSRSKNRCAAAILHPGGTVAVVDEEQGFVLTAAVASMRVDTAWKQKNRGTGSGKRLAPRRRRCWRAQIDPRVTRAL